MCAKIVNMFDHHHMICKIPEYNNFTCLCLASSSAFLELKTIRVLILIVEKFELSCLHNHTKMTREEIPNSNQWITP